MNIVKEHLLSEPTNGSDSGNSMYTVELEPDVYVDVKYIKATGLIYILQNHDGSEAYRNDPMDDYTLPGYQVDEQAVIALVAAKINKEGGNENG